METGTKVKLTDVMHITVMINDILIEKEFKPFDSLSALLLLISTLALTLEIPTEQLLSNLKLTIEGFEEVINDEKKLG